MKPKNPKRTPEEVMKAIEDARWREEAEEIEAMSDDEVDAELRAAGGDPAKIRAEGAALAARLLAERTSAKPAPATQATEPAPEAPLEWQTRARAKLDEVRAMSTARTAKKTKRSRDDLLAALDVARNSPRFAQPVAAMFRKRTAEESTDEELEAFLESIDLLTAIDDKSGNEKP